MIRKYEQLDNTHKIAIDESFISLARVLKEYGFKLNMSDPAEKVIDAITEWVVNSENN